jgi:HTH-type transcriptional regulator, sugar sensing transcriptional regulator
MGEIEMPAIPDENIILNFENLGLSNYEARTYLFLLRNGQSYGNEVSKQTGIPGSKIYETISRLVEKGLAYPIQSNPVRYQALPLKDFLNRKQKDVNKVLKDLEDSEELIQTAQQTELLWHISGRKSLTEKARELIDSAEKEILISLWPDAAALVKENLEAALTRGVKLYSLQFGDTYLEIGTVYKHIMVPTVHERHGSEMFLLVDKAEGMFMYFEKLKGWKGYYSSSQGMVRVIENYIRHDIYSNRLLQDHREAAVKYYGEDFSKLLDL